MGSYPRQIGGTSQTYAVEKRLLTPVVAILNFDKNGKLVNIIIED